MLGPLIERVQHITVTAGLFLIYIMGFGVTLILVLVFNRWLFRRKSKNDTFWEDAREYEKDAEALLRQV